jgi:hypothetical protein
MKKNGSLGIPVVDTARAQYIVVLIGLLLQHMGVPREIWESQKNVTIRYRKAVDLSLEDAILPRHNG